MAVYNKNGAELSSVYAKAGTALAQAYDVLGNELIHSQPEPQPTGDTEVLSTFTASSTINATTYANKSESNNWVLEAGTLKANYVSLTWNTTECDGFQFWIAVFDANGNPYMHSNKNKYFDSAITTGKEFYGEISYPWVEPGGGSNFTAIKGGSIVFKLPTRGTFKISLRRSKGSGTAVSSHATFGTWLNNGGLTVTAIYEQSDFEVIWLPLALDFINAAWGENATTQRNAMLARFNASNDAIPLFIQTDGHGNRNDGNVGCYNFSEATMGFIRNIQLGDYASYYNDGASAANHVASKAGLENYIPVLGNHEFLNNNSAEAELADLSTLLASFVAEDATLGSDTYGYNKVVDADHNVKYLIGQPYIPDENDSSGFHSEYQSDQWEWFIDEMEANDGYDIVVLNHEPYSATYTWRSSGNTSEYSKPRQNLTPLLTARKAKTSGTVNDYAGNTHSYDFTSCTSELLCVFHGHTHTEGYAEKTQNGYPVYIGTLFDRSGNCAYGLIDRDNGKLFIYKFNKSSVSEELALDL